jgi:predicted TIM-barrel fold metal-dependent hydrolase
MPLLRTPLLAVLAIAALSSSIGCDRLQSNDGKDAKKKAAAAKEKPKEEPDPDDERPMLTSVPDSPQVDPAREIASLRSQLEEKAHEKENGPHSVHKGTINAHEHLAKVEDLDRYLPAARAAGVAMTVVVASPDFTVKGKGSKGEPGMSENFEEVLKAAKAYPNEIIPFFAVDPKDPDVLERAKKHVAAGAKGVKLYSGHSNYYETPLDVAELDPLYSYFEETQLPMLWHINLQKFGAEFERVMAKHPKLNVMVPHYGVFFWRPKTGVPSLREMMRKYPTLYVDTSLGTRQILIDGMAVMEQNRELFQDFFKEFPDRVMWGTDGVISSGAEKSATWFSKVIDVTRDQLERDVFHTELAAAYSKYFKKNRDPDGKYLGLALPPETLEKIYVTNPRRWLKLP